MVAEKMDFKEWAEQAKTLVGKTDRGWQKLAAEQMKISEMTIVKAKKRDEAGLKMVRALREAQAQAQERAQNWAPLSGEAGRWAIAVPEERAGGDVVCEIIVTHMSAPRFIAFFAFKADGSVDRRADFLEACAATEMQTYMRAAEERAAERCKAERMAKDQRGRRGEIIRLVAQQTGLDRAELEKYSTIDLLAMNNRFDEETRDDMQEDVQREVTEVRKGLETDGEKSAFETGMEIGQMMLGERALGLLKAFGSEAADTAAGLETAYYRRKLARVRSKRRAKEEAK